MDLSNIGDLIPDNLTPKEYGEILYVLTKDKFKEKPVDIETFVNDPYYLGGVWGKELYPYWMDLLKTVYPSPIINPFNEVILSCATGSGKSVVTTISLLYELYKLMCLKNPQEYYNVSPSTVFVFSLFSKDKGLALSVNWKYFEKAFSGSPFFRENIKIPKGKGALSDEGVYLTPDINFHVGSSLGNALGKAVIGAVMDEANFSRNTLGMAQDIYTGILDRRKSRFMSYGGQVPGIIWLSSSPNDENDYVSTRIKEVLSNKYVHVIDNIPRWDIHRHKGIYLGDKFKIFLGDEKRDPCIVDKGFRITEEDIRNNKIINVPSEHYQEFKTNLIRSIRDVAGRRVSGETALFDSKERLRRVLVAPLRFESEVIQLSFDDPEDTIEKHISNLGYFKNPLHPHSYRFIHLDIALTTDRYGLACTYSTMENIMIANRNMDYNLNAVGRQERFYYTEWAIGIEPKKQGEEVNLQKIVNFIFYLKGIGYPVYLVTCDQSKGTAAHTRQLLELGGVNVEYLSVDKAKQPWEGFKDCVINEKILGPKHELLITELYNIRDTGKKYDHPLQGCFVGDTKVKLLNGEIKTMEELANLGRENKFWVYSCLPDGTVVPGEAYNAHITKSVNEITEIILDNDEIIRCTPDHLFMLRNGEYKQASELNIKESLMPLNTQIYKYRYKSGKTGKYEMIRCNKTGKRKATHKIVAEHEYGKIDEGYVVHHYNIKSLDNSPSNLEILSLEEHTRRHALLCELGKLNIDKRVRTYKQNYKNNTKLQKLKSESCKKQWESQEYREYMRQVQERSWVVNEEAFREGQKLYANSEKGKKLSSEIAQKYFTKEICKQNAVKLNQGYWKTAKGVEKRRELAKTQLVEASESRLRKQDERGIFKLGDKIEYLLSYRHAMIVAGGYRRSWERRFPDIDFKYNASKLEGKSTEDILILTGLTLNQLKKFLKDLNMEYIMGILNHKIKSIRTIKLDKPVEVYDITVPTYNNFALSSGIFVHNSKDTADAVVGSYSSCASSTIFRDNTYLYDGISNRGNEGNPNSVTKIMETEFKRQCKDKFNKIWGF